MSSLSFIQSKINSNQITQVSQKIKIEGNEQHGDHKRNKYIYLYKLPKSSVNILNSVHGGFIYSLYIRIITDTILKINPLLDMTNLYISNISIIYLKPCLVDDEIEIVVDIIKFSRNLIIGEICVLSIKKEVMNKGNVIFYFNHIKF